MQIQMVISEWKVNKLSLDRKEVKEEGKNCFSLDVKKSFDFGDKDFYISFNLNIDDSAYKLEIEAIYKFHLVDGVIDDAFKNSSFPKVNAPAIAFPYLRATVANITLQSGLEPLMLPSINFSKMNEESEQK